MLDGGKYETLENIEWRYESWEYDQTEIYRRRSDGALFHASDSGCSCPMPFEYVTEADLKPIRTMQDFQDLCRARYWCAGTRRRKPSTRNCQAGPEGMEQVIAFE